MRVFFIFLSLLVSLTACKYVQQEDVATATYEAPSILPQKESKLSVIPQKVYDTYSYIKKNNRARNGYVGGRKFGNYEQLLPKKEPNGKKIYYKEWDVNPKKKGKNRGAQRLVTGSDGSAYYTNDHYASFTKLELQ